MAFSGTPPTPEQTVRVLTMHAKGVGRNEISKKLNVSRYFVSKIVSSQNETFDRTGKVQIMVAATKADMAKRRAALADRMLTNAQMFAEMVDQPTEVYSFGGKDNVFASEVISRPPTAGIRDLTASAQMAAKTSLELERADNDEAAGEKSLLAQFALALGLVQNTVDVDT